MPVDTFAGFVAEEALGIAVGAASLAVIPVVVPMLRTLSEDARPMLLAVVIQPAITTGVAVSKKVTGGASWYAGQWGDLVAEVHAMRAARHADAMTLAGLLARLPAARVLSDTPGRVRLKVLPLKGRMDRSMFIADAVSTVPGVLEVTASPHTCSVMIQYDTTCYVSLDALLDWIVAG
jgi:hypothetical protein